MHIFVYIHNRKIAIAWKKISERQECTTANSNNTNCTITWKPWKLLYTAVQHRVCTGVATVIVAAYTSTENRSTISVYDIPIHIHHYQHNKCMNCSLKWQVGFFWTQKLFFVHRQQSRHGIIVIVIIMPHNVNEVGCVEILRCRYDTMRYDTDMYYSHLNIDICQAKWIRQFYCVQKPDEWLSPFYFEFCCCSQCKKLNAISQCFCVRTVFHQIHNNAH